MNEVTTTAADSALDKISSEAIAIFESQGSLSKSLALARATKQFRGALTAEVMSEVMELMNTSLGFKTDQDPKRPSANNPTPKPYSVEVVRDCFIEATLRGFYPVNNEFNIIAGNFYGTAAGFERLVKKHPKVTNFKDNYEVPRMVGDKGAVVKCRAEWNQDGTTQVLEREFAVRVNAGMGADAINGKAKRKLLAAVHGRLSGVVTPEGDAVDTAVVELKTAATPASELFTKPAPAATVATDEPPMDGATPLAAKPETLQQKYSRLCGETKVTFDDFRSFVGTKNIYKKSVDSWASFDDVPDECLMLLDASPRLMAELIKKFGTVTAK